MYLYIRHFSPSYLPLYLSSTGFGSLFINTSLVVMLESYFRSIVFVSDFEFFYRTVYSCGSQVGAVLPPKDNWKYPEILVAVLSGGMLLASRG